MLNITAFTILVLCTAFKQHVYQICFLLTGITIVAIHVNYIKFCVLQIVWIRCGL